MSPSKKEAGLPDGEQGTFLGKRIKEDICGGGLRGGGRVERYREEVLPFLIAFLKVVRPDEDREGGCLSSEEPAKN